MSGKLKKEKQQIREAYMAHAATMETIAPTKKQRTHLLWTLAEPDDTYTERLVILVASLASNRDDAMGDFRAFLGRDPEMDKFVLKLPFGYLVDHAKETPVVTSSP